MTKQVVTALKMVPLFEMVAIPSFVKFIDATSGVFAPDEIHANNATKMLDELLRWSDALRVLRPPQTLS